MSHSSSSHYAVLLQAVRLLRCVLLGFLADSFVVKAFVFVNEELVGLCLRGTVRVRSVKEVLNADEHLFDRDGGPPVLLFVQNTQAYCAGRVDIRVEKRRLKLTLRWLRTEESW